MVDSKNLGNFYRYVNKRLSHRDAIGALVDGSGNVITADEDKANMFNSYYASVGVIDNGCMSLCHDHKVHTTLDTITFTEAGVVAAITKLKPNLSSGPDNLPPLFLKKLKHSLARPLALLYNQLMSVCYVPDSWKSAIIIPVFKKGAAEKVDNYRPISLTCVAGKIMERLIAAEMYEHLRFNGLLSGAQHGFIKGKSTCTNLLECINDWTIILQNRKSVTVAYIDFKKAFDTVSHGKLFARLYSYGIRGQVLSWIKKLFYKPDSPDQNWMVALSSSRLTEWCRPRQRSWARLFSRLY